MDISKALSLEFNLKQEYAENIIALLDEGCTVPFISRYRKEMHGSCDDQVIRDFADRLEYLRNFEKRKEEIIKLITEQEKMTPEIMDSLDKALTLTELDDIYRPFRPKRQTRATIAEAKGLKPLAEIILAQKETKSLEELAKDYINEEKQVLTVEDALQGANDIIAEMISDNAEIRKLLREFLFDSAQIVTTLKPGEKYLVYQTYENYKEPVNKIPSHRILAINRGEKEDCLKVDVETNDEKCLEIISGEVLIKNGSFAEFLTATIQDSFERLILPSLIRELRNTLTDTASEQAIKMFEVNLKPLLMQPPLKDKVILGLDPAYRTGCKVAVIDTNGNVIDKTVIFPTPPHNQIEKSEQVIAELVKKHKVDAISIGNGTASKESEIFVSNLIKKLSRKVEYMVVNEAGASVYSASKVGAEEFPDYDVTTRSAVSIARRLQDPLAELIKIDVKSIGVGQYQHDMPQKRLSTVLDGVVEDCVNSVGVDLNTASYKLLEHISGLNAGIAKNIVEYRRKNGKFTERKELLNVSKLGEKAFVQCAGFLRIPGEKNILDNTGVHPESYTATKKLLKMFNMTEKDVANDNIQNLPRLIGAKGEDRVAEACGIGVPTLNDIVKELLKPGRDIRDDLPKPELRSDVMSIEDLKVGMVMNGTVRNVIDFGAFVDIGVHQDGLVHISEVCERYIKHPSEELTVGQVVKVKIINIDLQKQRIGLSIKRAGEEETIIVTNEKPTV
ncbi:MAG: RNA-binding transcriptional accessory protein [Clostridia bacterium]|nr:RNA-binding transcriptional accessory protein [Clostridia bacterium]